jgi:hypothetical protein
MNHSIYVSGNQEVLENMKKQGIEARHFARSDDHIYTGTKIRQILAKTPQKFQPSFMEVKDDRPF